MTGSDQVSIDEEVAERNNIKPRPWEKPFTRNRLREMVYTLLSWPYTLVVVMTTLFIVRETPLTLYAMLTSWTLAFARREFANWMAGRKPPGT